MRKSKKNKSLKRRMSVKQRVHHVQASGGRKKRGNRRTRSRRRFIKRQKGGYSQYQSNEPFNKTYSLGGVLSANESALANPSPIDKVFNQAYYP